METIDKYLNEYKENINDFDKAYDILYKLEKYIFEKSLNNFGNPTTAYKHVYAQMILPLRSNLLSYTYEYISKAAEEKILNILIIDLKEKVKQLLWL